MLVLSRRKGESIMVGDIEIIVNRIDSDKVRLAIKAPRDVPVHRLEVYEAIQLQKLIPAVCCECGGSGRLDYGAGETNCPICTLDTTTEGKNDHDKT